ncbi:unnamed protein product [Caenorhabditis auriculariae]|uniref:ATP synthase mitochondrial F1 complex assembly factor 2 n=1 Tax=Caenorhabditis auriculariae TaxID=2777116 RepID=A0A8S1HQI2_9PELO|nr:unnamed protein product [Caenorhabditis auriculariae]
MSALGTFARRFFSAPATASALTKRKRFYKNVLVVDEKVNDKQIYKVALDNRILKTQAGQVLQLESKPLALAIAQEWASQEEFLRLGQLRLTGLAFTAQDNPLEQTTDSICKKILEYVEGDTILFWNPENEKLHRYQTELWRPLIGNINKDLNLRIKASESILDCDVVSENDRFKLDKWIRQHNFPSLIALQYATESVKSFLITYNALGFHIDAEQAVKAATLEQQTQAETWGNVEWAHDVERAELLSRLSSAALFFYYNSNRLTQKLE